MRNLPGAYRLFALLCGVVAGGCDDPWKDHEDAGTSSSPSTETPDASTTPSTRCYGLVADLRQSNAQTSGAFCFGVASGLSAALVCGADANATVCRDDVIGVAYVVRWSGTTGAVIDGSTGARAGSVSQVNGTAFEVTTKNDRGICKLVTGPNAAPYAQFCAYED